MIKKELGEWAKERLIEYVSEIDAKLDKYWDQEVSTNFGFNQRQKDLIRDALRHSKEHNLRKAKRLRGSFVRYGYLLGGKKPDQMVIDAEMGVEVVHTAILMHDDVMDQDKVRRGGPTTHIYFKDKFNGSQHFGESAAYNVGDAVLCLGFELVARSGNNQAIRQVLRGVANTAYGQLYDVTLEELKDWTEDDVVVLHRAKTAIYTYENPLLIGAYMAGLSQEVVEILKDYSQDGGVAFQLQDDILGVFGDEEKTGKSADSDLRQGKCTLLVLKVIKDGTDAQKEAVMKVWGKFDDALKSDIELAKQAIKDSGSYDYSKQMAVHYAKKAADTAALLRNKELKEEAIDFIQGIAEYMVTREV